MQYQILAYGCSGKVPLFHTAPMDEADALCAFRSLQVAYAPFPDISLEVLQMQPTPAPQRVTDMFSALVAAALEEVTL